MSKEISMLKEEKDENWRLFLANKKYMYLVYGKQD
jgi:hypothetical protein